MARISKTEQANEWFKAEIAKRLTALGATQTKAMYDYAVTTAAGRLYVTIFEDWIACRFEEVKRAKALVSDTRLNPYSGKWNHHYDPAEFQTRRTAKLRVDCFFTELDRYLPDKKE